MASTVFSLGSVVYVRYKDHVLFKNILQPFEKAMERETIGWLSKENSEIILVEHDRTMPNVELGSGKSNGLILLKCCILEIRKLPLQESSEWHLNAQSTKDKDEYALQPKKRKTQPKTNSQEQTHCKQ
jgi:hypothetical protein